VKSSVIKLLQTFSKQELSEFEIFLDSPYFNTNKNLQRLLSLTLKFLIDNESDILTKEKLWKEMFPAKIYSDGIMRNLLYELNKCAENYLRHKNFSKNFEYDKALLNELFERNHFGVLEKKLDLFEKKINTLVNKDENYLYNKIYIVEFRTNILKDKSLLETYRYGQSKLQLELFLLSFSVSELSLFIEEQRANVKHNSKLLESLLGIFENKINDFGNNPLIQIYLLLCLAFVKPGYENCIKAKKIFEKNYNAFDVVDKKNIYSVFQTIFLKYFDAGILTTLNEVKELYIEMINDKDVLEFRSGKISLNLFRNILSTFLTTNEFELAKSFIENYMENADTQNLSHLREYSLAHLYFSEGDYRKVLEICNKIDYNNFFESVADNFYYKIDIKRLIIKSFFEMGDWEGAIYMIDSAKHFITNSNSINSHTRESYLTFLKLTEELIRKSDIKNKSEIELIKYRILKMPAFGNKKWLQEKIEEILSVTN